MLEFVKNNFLPIISCTFIIYRPTHDLYNNVLKCINLIPFDDRLYFGFKNIIPNLVSYQVKFYVCTDILTIMKIIEFFIEVRKAV